MKEEEEEEEEEEGDGEDDNEEEEGEEEEGVEEEYEEEISTRFGANGRPPQRKARPVKPRAELAAASASIDK